MAYTLQKAFDDACIRSAHQITACEHFDRIEVTGISVQENPMAGFVKQGEIVLTTAIDCERHPERFQNIIDDCAKGKAAAVLFTFRDREVKIPGEVVKKAEQTGLPLFEIPWKCRFSDIQSRVLKAIHNDKVAVYHALSTQLFSLFLSQASFEKAVELIESKLNFPIGIENRLNYRIAGSLVLENDERKQSVRRLPICIHNKISGYVILPSGDWEEDKYTLFDKNIIRPLTLWFYQKEMNNRENRQIRNEYIWNLSHGSFDSYEDMLRQGISLNMDFEKQYVCMSFEWIRRKTENMAVNYSVEAVQMASDFEETIIDTARKMHLKVLEAIHGTHSVVYLEARQDCFSKDVECYTEKLMQYFRKKYGEYLLYIGVCMNSDAERYFTDIFKRADFALTCCKRQYHGEGGKMYYKDTKQMIAVKALADNEYLRKMADELINPNLPDHLDQDALLTLKTYIGSNYNTSATARMLHLHRQSLIYRLNRIEACTGMSLQNHEDLFLLEIYLRISGIL